MIFIKKEKKSYWEMRIITESASKQKYAQWIMWQKQYWKTVLKRKPEIKHLHIFGYRSVPA